jgi:hypothetical protein
MTRIVRNYTEKICENPFYLRHQRAKIQSKIVNLKSKIKS